MLFWYNKICDITSYYTESSVGTQQSLLQHSPVEGAALSLGSEKKEWLYAIYTLYGVHMHAQH